MPLQEVAKELTDAGYRRPSVKEFVEADYKAEDYESYFEKYEASLLNDVKAGKVRFSRELDTLDEEESEVEAPPPAPAPTPPAPPKVKKTRPSMVYPGYTEEVDE